MSCHFLVLLRGYPDHLDVLLLYKMLEIALAIGQVSVISITKGVLVLEVSYLIKFVVESDFAEVEGLNVEYGALVYDQVLRENL